MAVPFIFPSVEVDGRRLVDGVVSDPLPLDAARDAELVLALGFEGAMPRRVDRASRLVAQATTSLINNLMQARLEAAVARGQRIVSIELGLERKVGLWETGALPYLYEAGRRAATHHLPRILELLEGRAQRQVA
jgi:NTE family protein